jgi:chemotaxis response regulator CheB
MRSFPGVPLRSSWSVHSPSKGRHHVGSARSRGVGLFGQAGLRNQDKKGHCRKNYREKFGWQPVRTFDGFLAIRKSKKQRKTTGPPNTSAAPKTAERTDAPASFRDKCIAIGISTGGPPALARLFESLRPPTPPILVVQHMPPNFTKPLAWRLDSLSKLSIEEATHGELLRPNRVLIAPGGSHMKVRGKPGSAQIVVCDGPVVSGHKPSVDVMMRSVVQVFGGNCLGVIMTGMGRDGADGCGPAALPVARVWDRMRTVPMSTV